jgi:hypothetical protein
METIVKKAGIKTPPQFSPAYLFRDMRGKGRKCQLHFTFNGKECRIEREEWQGRNGEQYVDYWVHCVINKYGDEFMCGCELTKTGISWKKYLTTFAKIHTIKGHIPYSKISNIYSAIPHV